MMEEAQSQQACTSTQPLKQPRFCCRCRNHGLTIPFKGHRQNCTYKTCRCDSCHLVTERRRIIAKQIALKRRLEGKAKKHAKNRPVTEENNTSPDGNIVNKPATEEIISPDNVNTTTTQVNTTASADENRPRTEDKNSVPADGNRLTSEEINTSPAADDSNTKDDCDGNNGEETFSEELELLRSSSPEDHPLTIDCSPSTLNPEESPASPTESPAMEMHSSEYVSGSGVIRVGQVIFKPIQSEDAEDETTDSSSSSPIETPSPETSPYSPISPEIDDKPDFTQLSDISYKDATGQSLRNLPFISKLSTPSAPSYGITPGVISSSNTSLSRMYPYDNTGLMASPARYSFPSTPAITSSAPFSSFATGQPNTYMQSGSTSSSNRQINVLMRIFPDHRPQFLRYVLESCGGDPLQCIETLWNMQDSQQEKIQTSAVIPDHCQPDKPSNPSTPVPSFQYIQPPTKPPPAYPTKVNIASGPLSPTDHQPLQHQLCQPVVISSSGSGSSHPTFHLQFANAAVMHQSIPSATNLTHPGAHNPNLYFGGAASALPDVMTLPKPAAFDSFLSPVAAPQLAMPNVSPGSAPGYCQLPSVPPSPHRAVSIQAPAVHVKQEHRQIDSTPQQHPSSMQSHLPPPQTTQMYCQTIGRIQPGKCLSYTSMQAVASGNPSKKPILLPVMTEVAGVRENQSVIINNHNLSGEHLSGSNSAFTKRLDYKTMLTNAADEIQSSPLQYQSYHLPTSSIQPHGVLQYASPNPAPGVAPQLGALPAGNATINGLGALAVNPGTLMSQHRPDAVAAQVLMSLGASPGRKQQDQTSLKDLLIEEE